VLVFGGVLPYRRIGSLPDNGDLSPYGGIYFDPGATKFTVFAVSQLISTLILGRIRISDSSIYNHHRSDQIPPTWMALLVYLYIPIQWLLIEVVLDILNWIFFLSSYVLFYSELS
jgi:hypothetical protein